MNSVPWPEADTLALRAGGLRTGSRLVAEAVTGNTSRSPACCSVRCRIFFCRRREKRSAALRRVANFPMMLLSTLSSAPAVERRTIGQ